MLRVVRGEASDEEIAALTVVVAGLAGVATPKPLAPCSAWADPARRLRAPRYPGPGAWRMSALPHQPA